MPEFEEVVLDRESHTYRNLQGIEYTSVNKLLSNCGLIHFPDAALPYLAGAAVRGDAVHIACDLLDAGILDWSSLLDEYKGYAESYQLLLDNEQPCFILAESYFCDAEYYVAGTVDRLVENGKLAVWDLKTSRSNWKHYRWQLAGYSYLVKKGFGLEYLPDRYIVKLRKDGKMAKLIQLENNADHDVFMACAIINKAKREE